MQHKTSATWVSGIRQRFRLKPEQRWPLTQQQFAETFGIPPATFRKWEQGIRKPTGPANALLAVIEREPEAVMRALDN